jgi:hypothetical protein
MTHGQFFKPGQITWHLPKQTVFIAQLIFLPNDRNRRDHV